MITLAHNTHLRLHLPSALVAMILLAGLATAAAADASEAAPEPVPPLTPALQARIEARPDAAAALKPMPNGSVQLFIDGQPFPFVFGCTPMYEPMDTWRVAVYRDAGLELIHVFANIAFYDPRRGYGEHHRPFWLGRGQYDRGMVEELLWRILRVHPSAKILLTLSLDAYPGWFREFPEELMRNEDGQGFIVGHHFQRIGGPDDLQRSDEVLAWSFFSEQYRDDVSEAIRQFIATVQACPAGKAVIGYVIGGGQDLQNYMWHPPNAVRQQDPKTWGDYSRPAVQAWRRWLEQRYQTIGQLNRRWRSEYAGFTAVAPPSADSLIGEALLHDPATEQAAIDWKTFLAQGRTNLLLHFAEVVKHAAGKPVIMGTYSGESACRIDLTDNGRLLRSEHLDFLFHQPSYGDRLPPSPGGMNAVLDSHQVNGKQFIADMDFRTWKLPARGELVAGKGVTYSDISTGRAADMGQLRSMWRRAMARLWAAGVGCHFHPLHAADMFDDPQIIAELAFLRERTRAWGAPAPRALPAETVVIFDEHAIAYLKGGLARLHWDWWRGQMDAINVAGLPYRVYYADDLRDGLVPPGRLYLFVNLLDLDPALADAIEDLKRDGATLVFNQWTGYAQTRRGQADIVNRVLGMQTAPANGSGNDPVTTCSTHPLQMAYGGAIDIEAEGLHAREHRLVVIDPQATPLATYHGQPGEVALAVRQLDGARSVFVGTPLLSSRMIQALARYSGATVPAAIGNVVVMTDDFVMLHPMASGSTTLTLPEPRGLSAMPPQCQDRSPARQHRLNVEAGVSYLFELKP